MHGYPPPKSDRLSSITGSISLVCAVFVLIAVWQSWAMYIRPTALLGVTASFAFVFRQVYLKRSGKDHPYKWDALQASLLPILSFFVCLFFGLRLHLQSVAA